MRVAIIHPWFPQYRAGFFDRLVDRCAAEGIDLTIFHGDCPPEWRDRNDEGSSERFVRLPTRFIPVGGRSLSYKSLGEFTRRGPFDLVVLEQAVRSLETYRLLLAGVPLAYWGHGRTYTVAVSPLQERLKQWLTRGGRWFFGYTAGGVDAVVAAGFPRSRTTVVQNCIDTSALAELVAAVTPAELAAFNSAHDLRGKTALFLGGIDESKRIGFLVKAAEAAHRLDPDFRLLIAGAGAEQALAHAAAVRHPFVTCLGSVFGAEKGLVMRAADVIAMPGRVGLIAVDSFAARTPIVTTDWPWHAPEFEYLESGINAVITADDADEFAAGLIRALGDGSGLSAMATACGEAAAVFTEQAMLENFVTGLTLALAAGRNALAGPAASTVPVGTRNWRRDG